MGWLGHGLGGQLGLGWCGWSGGEGLASMVALCAPVRFERSRSPAVRLARAASLLPSRWRLPTRAASRAAAPWFNEDGISPATRVRGALRYASEDVSVGLLAQMCRWMRDGSLVDSSGTYDYTVALGGARVPLLCVAGHGDALALRAVLVHGEHRDLGSASALV